MSKTKEELESLKNEYESLTSKLRELTEEELNVITGGIELKPAIGLDLGLDKSNCANNQ